MDFKPSEKDFGGLTEPLQPRDPGAVVGAQYCLQKAEQFTLENAIFTKDWSITDANGQEVFRVRGKRFEWCKTKRELVDMEGNPVVLMEENRWSWTDIWKAFEPGHQESPLWKVRKSSCCSFGPRVQVFLSSNTGRQVLDFTMKGQWLCKTCTIFCGDQKVAEVVRDTSLKKILTSKSLFTVLVQPGVDTAFVFSLIVIMDKLYIHNCNSKVGSGCGGGGP